MSSGLFGGRPKPNSFVQVDLENAYARLGVSPLDSTANIKHAINQRLKSLRARLRRRSEQKFSEIEDEITEIQAIEARIASPKARERYDQEFPQNELLTVQPVPHDRYADPVFRSGIITAWLLEELGSRSILPTPESLHFWGSKEELELLNAEAGDDACENNDLTTELRPDDSQDAANSLDINMLDNIAATPSHESVGGNETNGDTTDSNDDERSEGT